MKTLASAAQTALQAGGVLSVGAVKIATVPPFLVWGGHGDLPLADGAGPTDIFKGIGDAGLVTATGSQLGGTEEGIELRLSNVDPAVVGLVDAADASGARVTVWRLLFDASGQTLLDATVYERGRVDQIVTEDVPGGTATITCKVETAARGLGRRTGRMTSDADHRTINAADGSCSRVTQAAEVMLAWGGKPPARAGGSIPGGQFAGGRPDGVERTAEQ